MSQSLVLVLQLKQEAEQQSADALAAAAGQVGQLTAQLEQMRTYQRQYLSDWQQRGAAGISAGNHQAWHRFIGQLEETIGQLLQQVQLARQAEQQRRAQWLAARSEVKAVEVLLEKRREEAAQKQAKQEQKLLDELSGIRYFHQTQGR